MERSFGSLEELRAEISLLKVRNSQQESAIHEKLSGPLSILKTIGSLFKPGRGKGGDAADAANQDIISVISRVLLPVILNSSIFRGSNFITKTLVTLFSQNAAKNVNMDLITNTIERITKIFKAKPKSAKKTTDYGIPPDSETY